MKIKIITNLAPKYRASLWKNLLQSNLNNFDFSFSKDVRDGIETINFSSECFKKYEDRFHYLNNFYVRNRWLFWQSGVLTQCLFDVFDVAIFLGDANCLSTWVAAIICRLKRKRVIFWSHGFYGNEGKFKKHLRKYFYKIANTHLLYGRRAKSLMIEYGFDAKTLHVIFNSLDYEAHKRIRVNLNAPLYHDAFHFFKSPSLPVIVFIGRLTSEKKITLLVEAINKLNSIQIKFNLLIIGGGIDLGGILSKSKDGLDAGWIHFTGPIYDEDITATYLFKSDLCVSPGNVGLTAIHSLSLGTPVCTHSNMAHQMPEAESILDGYNGFYFEENNLNSLVDAIRYWFSMNTDRTLVRNRCYEIIDKFYNPAYQLAVIDKAINGFNPEI